MHFLRALCAIPILPTGHTAITGGLRWDRGPHPGAWGSMGKPDREGVHGAGSYMLVPRT